MLMSSLQLLCLCLIPTFLFFPTRCYIKSSLTGSMIEFPGTSSGPKPCKILRLQTCPRLWASLAGGCFKFTTEKLSWEEAKERCVQYKGRLVEIESEEQNEALYQAARNRKLKQVWIGLSDVAKEGEFVWTSGEKPTFTNWAPGEPSNYAGKEDCTTFNTEEKTPPRKKWRTIKKWNDGVCAAEKIAICERN